MITKNNKEATGIYRAGKIASAVYRGARLVWQRLRGIFAEGFWMHGRCWTREDYWTHND